ncbi:MAG: DNA mismatch repair endonuclease MutL [Elusimicrobiota bacterium]
MSKIKILPSELVNKIAAGEVIERPASVVKELIENAIDAGATSITAKIEASGKKLIAVSDNGCGMSESDTKMSVERHSTSKISDITDLEKIATFGFRGEALPSIASVSEMRIITKEKEEGKTTPNGTDLKTVYGRTAEIKQTGCPVGTTVEVKNLFQNLPARLKFLKSDTTERNKIISVITEYAIGNYYIGWRLISDDRELFLYPPADTLKTRIAQVFGTEFLNALIELYQKHPQINVHGYISKPELTFLSRDRIFIFINNRPVSSRMIVNAIRNGYSTFLGLKESPAVFLFLELSPEMVDVNVHPTKREVRFKDESAIFGFILQTVQLTLATEQRVPEIKPTEKTIPDFSQQITKPSEVEHKFTPDFSRSETIATTTSTFPEKIISSTANFIGRFAELYIVAEYKGDILIIDQHAAQERVLYEKFKQTADTNKLEKQILLFPVNLELSPKEFDILSQLKDNLEQLGFEIQEFGKNSFIVKSVPTILSEIPVLDMVNEIIQQKKVGKLSDELNDTIIKIACKSAVKSGDKLSQPEATKLVDELLGCANPYNCPHGRPTIVKLTKAELDRKFLRK